MHAGTCVHESLLHRRTDSTRFLGRGYHHEGRAPRRYDARHRGLVKMELSGAARPAQGSSEGMADGDHDATINLFHFPIVLRALCARPPSQPVSTCKSTSDPRADGLALCVLHAWCTRIFTAAPPSPLRPFGLQERGRWTRSKYEASVDVPCSPLFLHNTLCSPLISPFSRKPTHTLTRTHGLTSTQSGWRIFDLLPHVRACSDNRFHRRLVGDAHRGSPFRAVPGPEASDGFRCDDAGTRKGMGRHQWRRD